MLKVQNNTFNEKNLKYLNIKGATIPESIKSLLHFYLNGYIKIICKDEQESFQCYGTYLYSCCNFEALTHQCDWPNYISIYYERSERNTINGFVYYFMISGYSIWYGNEDLNFKNDTVIEMYMKPSPAELYSLFAYKEHIISIDFSNFDASEMTSLQNLFTGCSSLKSLDLSMLNASKITKIEGMASYCPNLETINISHVTTGTITNAQNMFIGLNKLKIIDISGLTFGNGAYNSFIENLKYLKYVDIKGSTLIDEIKNYFKNTFNNLTICQDKSLIIKDSYNYVCCDYNEGIETCEPENYMIIYLKEEINTFYLQNYYKDNIRFIINGETGITKEELSTQITVGSKFKIYFSSPLTTLEHFFERVKNIVSVDLSHMDLSLVTTFQSMFKDSSLSLIDLSNLNAPSLTNMSEIFEGCSELLLVNLSNLNTSKVNDMGNLHRLPKFKRVRYIWS